VKVRPSLTNSTRTPLPATQLAVAAGLRVVATARPDAVARMRALGAATIDYSLGGLADTLDGATDGPLDGVLDLVGDARVVGAAAALLVPGGRAVSAAYGVDGALSAERRVSASNYLLDHKPELLERALGLLVDGRWSVPIDAEVALDDVPRAVAAGRGGARGKTVVPV
jgi:NADPH:quinone reductase